MAILKTLTINGVTYSVVSPVPASNVVLRSDAWVENNGAYSQKVQIAGVTKYSRVDLTPSVDQLTAFYDKSIAFVTENDGGEVTVYAIGDKPQNDYTMRVNITEVAI